MRNIVTGLMLAAMLSIMVMAATPVSAEDTTVGSQAASIEAAGQIVEVDAGSPLAERLVADGWTLGPASPTGQADAYPPDRRFSDGDLDMAFEDGYLAGAQDAIADLETAKAGIVEICSARGGVVAEDYSCILNPDTYYKGGTR